MTSAASEPIEQRLEAPPARTSDEGLLRRLAFLQRVSAALAGVLETVAVVAAIQRLAVEGIADFCLVERVLSDGTLVPLDPGGAAGNFPRARALHDSGLLASLRAGRSELVRQGDRLAFALVPLQLPRRGLGALTLCFADRDEPPGTFELALAETLVEQAEPALARARIYEELQRALGLRDESFASAAQELGNPLAALRLQHQALLRGTDEELMDVRLLARLRSMEKQIDQLGVLTRRMLDVSLLSSGGLPLQLEELDLSALVQDVLARHADQLAWNRYQVSFRAAGPVRGRWDRVRLEEIAGNLVANAARYSQGDPVAVSVSTAPSFAILEVRGGGPGIAEEEREWLFERDGREGSREPRGSMGLGLWLVRRMAEALGGSIEVESEPGAGAVFRVRLPSPGPPDEEGRPP